MIEVKGDLIQLAKAGQFDVIAHGCNCQCTMGGGLAPKMAEAFGCDRFLLESYPSMDKLGDIDSEVCPNLVGGNVTVINAYTQFRPGKNLDYEALTLCLRKINHFFIGQRIGLPQIGCGIAGGDWDRVKQIIETELKDCEVTIVMYETV